MSDQAELIPVLEAAARIGVHKNTMHARLAAGWYRWEWMPAKRGRQKGVHVADLHNTGPIDPDQSSRMHPMDPSIDPGSITSVQMDPSGRMDASPPDLSALVNAALMPLVDQIRELSTEKGRLEERVRSLESQLAERPAPALPADMSPPEPPWWKRLFRKDQR